MPYTARGLITLVDIAGEVVLGEEGEEVGTGEGAWIDTGSAETPEDSCTAAVLCRSNILEVIGRAVMDVTVEVVNLHVAKDVAVGVKDRRSRTEPGEGHEGVAHVWDVGAQQRIA